MTMPDLPIWIHDLFVYLGVCVAAVIFGVESRRRGVTDPRMTWIVVGALGGGAIFMHLGTWFQHLDPRQNASFVEHWLYGNKSILGGLFGAWLGVHIAKRATGYRLRTGDLFAPAVALGLAVGRVGCLLTEAPGTPTGSAFGISVDAAQSLRLSAPSGVPLHPSFAYEILFHLLAFATLWWWLRWKPLPPGETLTIWLAAYGIFRFLVEFVRGNEVAAYGLTRPQWVLAVTVPLLVARLVVVLARRPLPGQVALAVKEL